MLEAEKRGSPPKSEKAAAFWRVGGAGRGVQPFCEKESEFNLKNGDFIAESSVFRHCEAHEAKRVQRSNPKILHTKRSNHPNHTNLKEK
ncbi:hypothetical protein ACWIUD_03515 [Helicobacter sp. 23-1044]